ncbi:hypothetical protein WA026_003185 [Henosepilachna vigintioctopunctata]|uniref:Uncharacterized protein n=1 Tax=Henosepilachna vigintioctopunctata TaxID=420089 RepID=A0AAW1TLI7_9CUCU
MVRFLMRRRKTEKYRENDECRYNKFDVDIWRASRYRPNKLKVLQSLKVFDHILIGWIWERSCIYAIRYVRHLLAILALAKVLFASFILPLGEILWNLDLGRFCKNWIF